MDQGPCFGHRLNPGLDRGLLQVGDRAQAQRDAQAIRQDRLGGPFGEVIGPRAPRGDRLHARAEAPAGDPSWPRRPGGFATPRADQAVPLRRGDDRRDPWDLRHLRSLGLRSGPGHGVLTVQARHRCDRDDPVHRLDRAQRPGLPLMAGLPARSTATRRAARPGRRLGRIRRRWLGGGARVAPQPLSQLLDRGLQVRHFGPPVGEHCCLRHDHRLRYRRRVSPYFWWQGGVSVHRTLT